MAFLPPILYLLCAVAALFAIDRWLLRLSRRAALVLVLLPLAFTGKALLTGRLYGPVDLSFRAQPLAAHAADFGVGELETGLSDLGSQIVPWRAAVRWSLRHGEWGLYNPFMLCGAPLLGVAQPAPYFLPNVLGLALPLPWALGFIASLQFLLAIAGAFLLARQWGCREGAALVAGAAWGFSNVVVYWIGWPLGATVLLLPLVLFAIGEVLRRPTLGRVFFLAVVGSQVAQAGHPESALHVASVAAVWALVELFGCRRSERRRALAAVAFAALLAAGLSAVKVLPVVDTVHQSREWLVRKATKDDWQKTDWPHAREVLVSDLAPALEGGVHAPQASYQPAFWTPGASAAVGILLLPAVLWGLLVVRPLRRRLLLGGLLLGGLLVGAKAPGAYDLVASLPFFDTAINDRLVFAATLALALLAALGIDDALRRERWRRFAAWCWACAGLLAALWAPLALRAVHGGLGRSFVVAQAATALLPVVALGLLARFGGGRNLLPGALALLLLQRALELGGLYPAVDPKTFYPTVPPLEQLASWPRPFRVVGQDFVFLPNDSVVYGVDDVRGYAAVNNVRFYRTWRLWAEREGFWFLRVKDLDTPFLDFLNVEAALTLKDAELSPAWQPVADGRSVRLWRNREALPRAYVPEQLRLGADPGRLLNEMEHYSDFRKRVWLEVPHEPLGALRLEANGPGEVLEQRRDGSAYELEVRMEHEGWLVVSEVAWRGWRVTMDGEVPLPVGFANHAFLATRVPAGTHRVRLDFLPMSFLAGAWLTGLTVLVMLGALVRSWWRGRRFRPKEPANRDVMAGAASGA